MLPDQAIIREKHSCRFIIEKSQVVEVTIDLLPIQVSLFAVSFGLRLTLKKAGVLLCRSRCIGEGGLTSPRPEIVLAQHDMLVCDLQHPLLSKSLKFPYNKETEETLDPSLSPSLSLRSTADTKDKK